MAKRTDLFRYFDSSRKVIRTVMMMDVKFPLCFSAFQLGPNEYWIGTN
jgi:hypothetical protein